MLQNAATFQLQKLEHCCSKSSTFAAINAATFPAAIAAGMLQHSSFPSWNKDAASCSSIAASGAATLMLLKKQHIFAAF
jgi:hypothetical protein